MYITMIHLAFVACVLYGYTISPLLKIIFSDFETIFNEHDTLNEIMRVRW